MVKFDLKKLHQSVNRPERPYQGVKGSIVRIRITNFVTYRDVELKAGQNINLVLGPNGTGKSTIVCAICLALGGKTRILSRAVNVKEYIRHGTKEASVEIELYNPSGDNYVVKRVIAESGGTAKSTWYYQNRNVNEKRIEELMASLNIQLDNLCQFLPQDRVQEFAKMDSVSLLKCTEMAIGADDLARKHDELISITAAIKKLEYSLGNIGESLRTEQQQNQRLQAEVQTYKEREELNEKINELKGKKLWLVYQTALEDFNELKEKENELVKKKQHEEKLIAPMKKAVERLEASLGKYRDETTKLRKLTSSKVNSLSHKFNADREKADTYCNELLFQIQTGEQQERDRLSRLNQIQIRIQNAELELEECRQTALPLEAVTREIDKLNAKKADIQAQIVDLNMMDEAATAERNEIMRTVENARNELRRMGDMRVARMKFLQHQYPDVFKTIQFFELDENRAKLKGELHDPPILSVFVDDLKFGSVAERHLRTSDLTAFFCEHKDDVFTISDLVQKEIQARVSVIHHICPPGFKKPKSSFSPEFMRKYHFEKVLIDLIKAPDYYMSYLVPTFKPETVPMGGSVLDKLTDAIMNETDLKAFYSEEYSYSVRTSSYSGAKFSTCSHLSSPKIFTTKINDSEHNILNDKIKVGMSKVKKLEASVASRASGLNKLEDIKNGFDEQMRDIRVKADRVQKLVSKLSTMNIQRHNVEREKKDLKELERQGLMKSYASRIAQLDSVEQAGKQLLGIVNEGLHQLIAKKQQSTLQSKIISKQNQYESARSNISELSARVKEAAGRLKAAAEESQKRKADAVEQSKQTSPPDDVKQGTVTDESLEHELSLAKVRLEFLADTSQDVIRKYQERCSKINDLENSKRSREHELQSLTTRLAATKAEWLGPLTNLIERVNANFARFFAQMVCAGCVFLDQGTDENDFSKYGIKIKVKFRAAEQLAELSGWKQSGGERAITTALYVLALQELTTVPFRVIDEINQGMDAKNEARFFKLLCSLAQGNNTPQYFLLTPKMLPEVDYPPNVQFHIIYSGPHVSLKNFKDSKGKEFSYSQQAQRLSQVRSASSDEDSSEESSDDEEDPEEVDLSDS